MQLRNYLMNWKILLLISLLCTSCSYLCEKPKVVTKVEYINKEIPIVDHPPKLSLNDIKFYVVTEKNFSEFKEKFINENYTFVFYAISVPDYERLSLNMADIHRYIKQQKEIIIYYENLSKEE